jgi:squalene-hopene/tetraprenyl-beta-curcumene cyclase
MRRAVAWLKARQNPDGGWGEDGASYALDRAAPRAPAPSTASQTAWALLALMAAGAAEDEAVERGAAFLLRSQRPDGTWPEEAYTGTGFPRVFYLRYHGYRQIFPVWALARLRALRRGNSRVVPHGL